MRYQPSKLPEPETVTISANLSNPVMVADADWQEPLAVGVAVAVPNGVGEGAPALGATKWPKMESIRARLAPDHAAHWSPAESSGLTNGPTAWSTAWER
jgi:hypothetical protein